MAKMPEYFHFRTVVKAKGTEVELHDVSDHDFVEVVRCKDCIHDNSNNPICPIPWVKRMHDSFCSFGERRVDDDTNSSDSGKVP